MRLGSQKSSSHSWDVDVGCAHVQETGPKGVAIRTSQLEDLQLSHPVRTSQCDVIRAIGALRTEKSALALQREEKDHLPEASNPMTRQTSSRRMKSLPTQIPGSTSPHQVAGIGSPSIARRRCTWVTSQYGVDMLYNSFTIQYGVDSFTIQYTNFYCYYFHYYYYITFVIYMAINYARLVH